MEGDDSLDVGSWNHVVSMPAILEATITRSQNGVLEEI